LRLMCLWLLLLLLLIPLQDSQFSAQALFDYAVSTFQSGDLARSQRDAAAGFRRYVSSNPVWAAKFQLLLAKSMLFRGMYDDALRTLSANRETWGVDGTVEKLAIEAVALTRQEQALTASERLTQAESICSGGAYAACGDALAARGILEAKQGRFDDARQCFMNALSIARRDRNQWLQVSSIVNLAYIALQVGHYDEAVDWSRSASQRANQLGYKNLSQTAAGNLGWAYYELGDDERALDQFRAAGEAAARLENVRYELKWVNTAGYIYRDSGDIARASQSYRRALYLARRINSQDDIANALQDLADISFVSGQLNDADSYIRQVTSIESRGGGRHPSDVLLLTMGKVAEARGRYDEAERCFRSVQNDPTGLITTKLNAEYQLANLLALQRNLPAAERMYRFTLDAYDAARSQLKSEESQLPFGSNVAQIYDSYIHLLVQQGRSDAALAVADDSRARSLEQALGGVSVRKLRQTRSIDPRRISQTLDSTLLFYWLGENQSYLWAITPQKVALFTLPSRQKIAAYVESYRKTLLDLRDPLETHDADGQALYRMLIAPAATMIRSKRPVIVLNDGALSKLNFETLLAPDSHQEDNAKAELHYLIDDLTLSSAPSLAVLEAFKEPSDTAKQMLLLGNPTAVDRDFPPLPMFSVEMSRVGSHFASKQTFSGSQATPAAYVASQPDRYSYIHFVSHAVASSTTPLDSAIILSNSAGQENSYKLYAREIIQHAIHAKLVTISACYGSGTRAYAGEGLVGLSWAFLRAGAHQVIGALWEVSDDSTPLLMDRLYQGLENGQSPVLALHNAKLVLLHSQNRFDIPFYWAPFQIYGHP
jgi:CHAT domain-containing protein/Tfp pilus assembly protein PilF